MTAKEAWDIIHPYIDPMTHKELNTGEFGEAFCMVYIACKEYDKSHSKRSSDANE